MRYLLACLFLATLAHADGVLLDHTMPPVQLLHKDGTPVEGVAKSTSPGEMMEKAGILPCEKGKICEYKASWDISLTYRGVDEPVEPPVDPPVDPVEPPVDPVEPPVDPVEPPVDPVDPPVDPNEPTDCVVPDCPEVAMPYTPEFPPLGQYSVAGVCEAIHESTAPTVTLADGESMESVMDRLHKIAPAGGVVLIPWDVDTVQCDSFSVNKSNYMPEVTFSGVLGPNGEMPRFYCRSVKRDGTISKGLPGNWIGAASKNTLDDNGHMLPMSIVVENIHIDGYRGWVAHPQSGKQVIRNSYFHSGTGSGFTVTGLDSGDEKYNSQGLVVEMCGNEVSHGGQGNASHCFYEHRSQLPGIDYKFTLVDNTIHSCNGSSGFKSIANENYLYNNNFLRTKDVPTLSKRYNQVSVDVVSCAKTTIEGNLFLSDRGTSEDSGMGNVMIDFVQRRGLQGCDEPRPGPYDGTKSTPEPVLDNPFWTEQYWADLGGSRPFTSRVKNNTFKFINWKADKQTAIRWRGTYPGYTYTLGGGTCLLQAPKWWYERSEVISENNKFNQANDGDLYETDPPRAGYVFGEPWECNGIPMEPLQPPDPRVFAPVTIINDQYEVPM